MMRFFWEIILILVIIWQFIIIHNYQLEIQELCAELNLLLKNPRGVLLLRTNNKAVQNLILSINAYLETIHQKKKEFQIIKKELREMMINLSHDLKTPLTTLSGYVQLLHIRYIEDHNNQRSIEAILEKLQAKTEQTNRMIMQFLDIAKIESGDMEIEFLQLDIGRLCKEIIMDYYDILEINGFEVELHIETKPILIDSDKNAITCILHNLIDNALKYGKEGKYLGLTVRETEQYIFIEVEDHGQGISEDEQVSIFERNYRGRVAKQQTNNGSGLGLAICNKLSEKLYAELRVDSLPKVKTVFSLIVRKKLESRDRKDNIR